MNELFVYLLKANIGIAVFYLIYRLLMRNDTNFKLNRFYILLSLILSMITPLFQFESFETELPKFAIINSGIIDVTAQISTSQLNFDLTAIFENLYYAGLIVFSVLFVLRIYQIIRLIQKSEYQQIDGMRLILLEQTNAAFSFINYIFINRNLLTNNNFQQIFSHERIHAKQLHSVDVVLSEIICIVLWFNPFVWLMKKNLKETHEYLADAGVIAQGFSTAKYEQLLVKQTIGFDLGFTNNFNKSLTLKRLAMIKKFRSSSFSKLKALSLVPALALLIFAFACSEVDDSKKSLQNEASKEVTNLKTADGDVVLQTADVQPEFAGGDEALMKFIAENVKYPEEAKKQEITGKVFVQFIVNKTGKVEGIKTVKGVHPLLDAESERVIGLLPDWKPALKDGKPVSVYYTIPINFQLK